MTQRAAFGLQADRGTVMALIGSPDDVGTPKWGIPMTADEAALVDLPARMRFADTIDRLVLSRARGLATYSGAYVDQLDEGNIVILLSARDPQLETELIALVPDGPRSIRFELRTFTERELITAAEAFVAKWPDVGLGTSLLSVGLDEIGNRIVVTVEGAIPPTLGDRLVASFQIPVDVQAGERGSDVHCTTRDHCHGPTWAGIRIWKDVIDSVHECALGAHIRIGLDERFVTSGHCGYDAGNDNWLHPGIAGNHILGAETGQTLYVNNGQDIMVVQLNNDAESSDNIFPCCSDITGMGAPILNETLCVSLAQQATTLCRTVANTWVSWTSDTANPDITVWGGRLLLVAINGDSGSPVYRVTDDPPLQARAIGVLAHEMGYFARLDQSLDNWGAVVVN
jgi:hypothetical protein